ncbi:MAG: hypothetical protein LIQ31_07905, partial [Planctomycetes bacterium]|nr:hypothetical protein [Planctomycetota bacterium]
MPKNHLIAHAIHGLRARLELEEGLGSHYMTVSRQLPNAVGTLREILESSTADAPPPATRSR